MLDALTSLSIKYQIITEYSIINLSNQKSSCNGLIPITGLNTVAIFEFKFSKLLSARLSIYYKLQVQGWLYVQ